jgi:DNA-nicking Smr family endonuclease
MVGDHATESSLMDFKDILDRWEALEKAAVKGAGEGQGKRSGGKKANAPLRGDSADARKDSPQPRQEISAQAPPLREERTGGANAALEAWIAGHGTVDKDAFPRMEDSPTGRSGIAAETSVDDESISGKKVEATLRSWLAKHGVTDKDSAAGDSGEGARKELVSGREMSMRQPQARIDLHGLNAADAEKALKIFLTQCSRRGLEHALVVHGKGNHSAEGPILAGLVRQVLESDPVAGSHGTAHRSLGGRGATWVRIKRTDYFSR